MYRKNAWKKYADDNSVVMDFAEKYKHFLSECKTERLVTRYAIKLLEENGYVFADKVKSVKKGDKIYFTNKNKNVAAFIIGEKPLAEGMRILGAHIDSPRLDLKENPIYESKGFAMGNTHYYGGVKKYQWVTFPLALHGVIVKKDGTVVEVNIGEAEDDPIVGITDLLIHLSADQQAKPLAKAIEGEDLDISLGSIPLNDKEKEPVKANVLRLLKDKYGVEEEDFISAEIEVVPAGKARDYGLDKSMIAGYGHDDRVCAYTSLLALLDSKPGEFTSCCILVDKEEIGSVGATGAQSLFFENIIAKLAILMNDANPMWTARLALENSKMLSSDVSAAFDPLYASVNDPQNSAYFGEGIVITKYTGSRGKSGSNDANPEFYAEIRKIMDDAGVVWQTAELGKVDQGGGGTIAYILGNYNMNVIDAGIAVLSMHSPMEIVSKVDVYEAFLGYRAFLK
ncbi:MAG: aminopeptidase [Erysipelotrichaceae bacterium]|jgi:aspartyl aminopeptidase|nr:aminopeptidase [Bacilli bacterium]NLV29030.1 aminopeptidase [Erysipelotrichaceae bacterium]HPY79860.1 aminopeptidase [Bacilli bacterium]HQA55843.1 aminopeptidase [Bacilli bacterium]